MLNTESPATTPNLTTTMSNNDNRLPFRTTGGGTATMTPSTTKKTSKIITQPSKFDVLLGNSKEARQHYGTEYLNSVIVNMYHEYHAADRATDYLDRERGKKSKQDINKEIYSLIQSNGGRFLQKSKKTKQWEEIDIQRAINRISSSFGHKSIAERVQKMDEEKKNKKNKNQSTTSTEQNQHATAAIPPTVEAPTSTTSSAISSAENRRASGGKGGLSNVAKLMQKGVVKMVKRARSREFGSFSSNSSDNNNNSTPPQSQQGMGQQQQRRMEAVTRPSSLRSSAPGQSSSRRTVVIEQRPASTTLLPDFDKPHEYTMSLPDDDDDDDDSSTSSKEYDVDEELTRSLLLRRSSSLRQDSTDVLDRMPLRMESESSVLMNPELAEQLAATADDTNHQHIEPLPMTTTQTMNHHQQQRQQTISSSSSRPTQRNGKSALINKALLFQQRQLRENVEERDLNKSDHITFEYDSARFMRSAHLSTDLMDTFDHDMEDDSKRNRSTDTILSTEPARRRARQGASVDVLPAISTVVTTTPTPSTTASNPTTTTPAPGRSLLSIAAVASAKRLAFEERRKRTSQEKILMMRQKRSGQCTGGEETPASSQRALRLAQTVTTYQPQLEESSSFAKRLSDHLRQEQQRQGANGGGGSTTSSKQRGASHASSSMDTIAIDFSNLSMDTVKSLSSDEEEEEEEKKQNEQLPSSSDAMKKRTSWSLQSSATLSGAMYEEAAPSRDGLQRTSAGVLGSWLDEFENEEDDTMLSNLHDQEEVERDVRDMLAQLGKTDEI